VQQRPAPCGLLYACSSHMHICQHSRRCQHLHNTTRRSELSAAAANAMRFAVRLRISYAHLSAQQTLPAPAQHSQRSATMNVVSSGSQTYGLLHNCCNIQSLTGSKPVWIQMKHDVLRGVILWRCNIKGPRRLESTSIMQHCGQPANGCARLNPDVCPDTKAATAAVPMLR
jgi:hypothetical protein